MASNQTAISASLQEEKHLQTYDIRMIQILEHLHLVKHLLFIVLDEFFRDDPAHSGQPSAHTQEET
jgi:hypothetical protein